jgi:hypothetical protein
MLDMDRANWAMNRLLGEVGSQPFVRFAVFYGQVARNAFRMFYRREILQYETQSPGAE